MKKKEYTPQYTFRLDPVLREKLEAIAKKRKRSLSQQVNIFLEEKVEEFENATSGSPCQTS